MQRWRLIWGVTAVSAVLGFMLTVQITSRPSYQDSTTNYIDLRTQVQELSQEHQLLEEDISKTKTQLDEYQAAGDSQSNLSKVLQHDEKVIAEQAGITSVSGPGIIVTIKNSTDGTGDPTYVGQFQEAPDQWVQEIVNDLFGNGAKAISINGHRLVTTSSIRLVDSANGLGSLHVNGHPVAMPYVIKAVGNIADMKAALTVDQLDTYMQMMGETFTVQSHKGANGVRVPGYSGPLPGQYAKEEKGS